MRTGHIENWSGNMIDIGPLYPFVGSEFLLWIIALVIWLAWHYWQSRIERKEYDDDIEMIEREGPKDR